MKFQRNARPFRGQLDALPFVGVMFLLVLFLLLQSSFVFVPGVSIQLPESAATVSAITNATVTVAVDARGQLIFRNQFAREEDLRQGFVDAVNKHRGAVTLVLMADRSVPNEVIVRLVTMARHHGIREALLATRSPAAAGQP